MWRPIETAPKDGTTVIVAFPIFNDIAKGYGVTAARYYEGRYCDADVSGWTQMPDSEGVEGIWSPHFWQPLPSPPNHQSDSAPPPGRS